MGNRSTAFAIATALMLAFALGSLATALDYRGDYQERYPSYADGPANGGNARQTSSEGVSTPRNKTPCEQPQNREESDLCAQWRGANGTKQAAEWGLWQLIVSVFGVIGLGVTLWFNKRAIDIALASAAETGAATKAMERQNELTEIAQRPWITLIPRVTKFENHENHITIAVAVDAKNLGQSVALDVRLDVALQQSSRVSENQIITTRNAAEDPESFRIPVVPNDAMTSEIEAHFNKPFLRLDHISEDEKRAPISLFAAVRYRCHGDPQVRASERSWEIGEGPYVFDERGIRIPVGPDLKASDLFFHGAGDFIAT